MKLKAIGNKGKRIFNCKNPNPSVDNITAVEFWNLVEEAFIRRHNNTVDSRVFLITNRLKGDSGALLRKINENSTKLRPGKQKRSPISINFHNNIIDPQFKKDFLKNNRRNPKNTRTFNRM